MIRLLYRWVIAISLATAPATAMAVAPDPLLLERAGERVKQFWEEIAAVTCTEELSQEKLNEKGKVALRNSSRYDYLILLGWDGDQLLVDESRVEVDPPEKRRPVGSLLATRGFATLLLILHPTFQPNYSFTFTEADAGTNLVRVDFLPRIGGRSPGALELKGREYPIAWEGTAWIDPANAAVVRMEARWKEPPEALGLAALESDVRYAPVDLRGRIYWLPQSARIELRSAHQAWRNLHTFSGYRSFGVEVEDTGGGKKK